MNNGVGVAVAGKWYNSVSEFLWGSVIISRCFRRSGSLGVLFAASWVCFLLSCCWGFLMESLVYNFLDLFSPQWRLGVFSLFSLGDGSLESFKIHTML